MAVHHYKIYCETDAKWERWYLDESDPAPTTCPTDTAHTVTAESVSVVEVVGPLNVKAEIVPRGGQQDTMVDGMAIEANANAQGHGSFTMPDVMHMDSVVIAWKDFEFQDRGWLSLVHPAAQGNPAVDPATDQLDVGAMSPYFDPANGAQHVEFYSDDESTLLEVVGIASISGTVVTLSKATEEAYTTANHIKARFQSFNPVRGSHGLSGGFRFLGTGMLMLGSQNEMTDPIPAGMMLCAGIDVGGGGSKRSFGVNFVFRKVSP